MIHLPKAQFVFIFIFIVFSSSNVKADLSSALATKNEYCATTCSNIADTDWVFNDGYVIFLNMGLCPDGFHLDCPSCYSQSNPCPTCPIGFYYAKSCKGQINPNLVGLCQPCTNRLAIGYFYTSSSNTNICPVSFCTRGQYKPIDKMSCEQCTNAPPLNAHYEGIAPDLSNNCPWSCNRGFYFDSARYRCTACSIPSGAVLGESGAKMTSCSWTCPAGQYMPQGTSSCASPCPFNQYRNDIDLQVANCNPCPLPSIRACAAGTYYVRDKKTSDCSLIECVACTNLPSSGIYYYNQDPITKLSADPNTPNSCYYQLCPVPSVAGQQTIGCGGTSYGTSQYCTSINIWKPALTPTYTDLHYYLPQSSASSPACPTAPCTVCIIPGTYNAQCPAQNVISTTAGDCDSQCSPSVAFATFTVPQTRAVASPSDCPFVCNVGYYLQLPNIRVCAACQDSSVCNPGFYTEPCLANGANGNQAVCRACPASIGPQSGMFQWKQSLATFGFNESCQWMCIHGYYKQNLASPLSSICASCSAAIPSKCNIGFYPSATCLYIDDARVPPFCDKCILPLHSSAISSGTVVNGNASCAIECDVGYYWLEKQGLCMLWTQPSPQVSATCTQGGTFWGGGDSVVDNHCALCPPESQPKPYPINLQSNPLTQWINIGDCAWTCLPGSYLDVLNGYCIACLPGTFKNTSGFGICTECPLGQYQDQSGSQACILAPSNSYVLDNRTNFICFQGYNLYHNMIESICTPCTSISSLNSQQSFSFLLPIATYAMQKNMSFLSFTPNQCQMASFACIPGFYRSNSSTSSSFCIPCPFLPGVNVQLSLSFMIDNIAAINTNLFAFCGDYPSYMVDEQVFSCPPISLQYADIDLSISSLLSVCTPGYFSQKKKYTLNSKNMERITLSQCALCMNTTDNNNCPLGYTLSICNNGETNNTCRPCDLSLTNGQSWVMPDSCVWSCSAGYYYYMQMCIPCSSGAYQPQHNLNASSCLSCPAGTYMQNVAAAKCTACLPGTFSFSTGAFSISNCSVCAAGSFASASSSTSCSACAAGTYAPTQGLSLCYACPDDIPYSKSGHATNCSTPPPPCPPGFYLASSVVFPSIMITSTMCTACTLGIACPGGAAVPLMCPAGIPPLHLKLLATNLSQCGMMTSLSSCVRSTANAPKACPPNTSTQGLTGALSVEWCSAKPGFYGLPGTAALQCPYDCYCPAASILPISCPINAPFALEQSVSLSDCSANMRPPCRPGYYLPFQASTCLICPSGCYCPSHSDGIMPCDATSSGKWWSLPQSTSYADCVQKFSANRATCPSYTGSMGGLQQLPTSPLQCRAYAGCYFVPGTSSGVLCPAGYFCPTAALQPIPCPTSDCKYMMGIQPNPDICPPNTFAPGNTCISCIQSIFPPSNAYYLTAGACEFCCDLGYILLSSSLTSSQCILAPNTSSCLSSASGSKKIEESSMYMPAPIPCLNFIPACLPCLHGIDFLSFLTLSVFFEGIKPLTELQFIAASAIFSPFLSLYGPAGCVYTCQSGYVFSGDQLVSKIVVVNTSSSNSSNQLQLPIFQMFTLDSILSAAEATITAVLPICSLCPPGTYASTSLVSISTCIPCPANTYTPNSGATTCLKCDEWGYSAPGSSICSCIPGTHLSAILSSSSENHNVMIASYSCIACADGAPLSDPSNPFICIPCPAGTVCTFSSSTIHNDDNMLCPLGFFSASTVATTTTTTTTTTTAQQCLPCPQGTYTNFSSIVAASTACIQCPLDTYSTTIGATSSMDCLPCAEGFITIPQYTQDTPVKCVCPPLKYFEPELNICKTCSARCTGNASAVVVARDANIATTAACITAGSTTADFTCVCNQGFYGDGFSACTRCASPALCICPAGFYYNNRFNNNECTVCKTCPPAAITVSGSQCLAGSTADTTMCVCPALFYYSENLNQCIPCTSCPVLVADMLTSCNKPGINADYTQCICSGNLSGDGFFCT